MSRRVIGIDFGTTNSLCAWIDEGRPVVIPNDRGARFTPSVVSFAEGGEVLVGESAKNRALAAPEDTILGIKRLLGAKRTLKVAGRELRPEDVAAEIFRKLKRDAERFLGSEVVAAVITVPARFSDAQRRAVRDSAALAGIETLRLVNEPTAAALSRAWLDRDKSEADARVLVYDFGGGTFDVTVLRAKGRNCEVLASSGDERLGGMDIDAALIAEAEAEFRSRFGVEPRADRHLAQQLSDLVERAKIELSSREAADILMPFLRSSGGIAHPSLRITRERLEGLAAPFVERTLALTREALRDSGLEPGDIDALVLSGGSSRMPLVARELAKLLPRPPESRVNFEEIVAMGAAVEAAMEEGSAEGFSVRDVSSRAYGVEIDGGAYAQVVPRNEPLPARRRKVFTTVADGQETVEIHVLQGEGERAGANLSLGRFLLDGIRDARKGEPRILVEFSIDESDLLRVRAKDLDTGVEQRVVVAGSGNEDARKLVMLAESVRDMASGGRLDGALQAEVEQTVAEALAAARGGDAEARKAMRASLEALAGEILAAEQAVRERTTGARP